MSSNWIQIGDITEPCILCSSNGHYATPRGNLHAGGTISGNMYEYINGSWQFTMNAGSPITTLSYNSNTNILWVGTIANGFTAFANDFGSTNQYGAIGNTIYKYIGGVWASQFVITPSSNICAMAYHAGGGNFYAGDLNGNIWRGIGASWNNIKNLKNGHIICGPMFLMSSSVQTSPGGGFGLKLHAGLWYQSSSGIKSTYIVQATSNTWTNSVSSIIPNYYAIDNFAGVTMTKHNYANPSNPTSTVLYVGGYNNSNAIAYSATYNTTTWTQAGDTLPSNTFITLQDNTALYGSTNNSIVELVNVPTMYNTLVSEGLNDIVPFTFDISNTASSSSTLDFNLNIIKNYLDYSQLVNTNSVSLTSQANVYVPYTEDSKYKINGEFYADVLVNGDGVKEYSLRSQENVYSYKIPEYVYNTPRFSWTTQINGLSNSEESSIDLINGNVWVATSNTIYRIDYNSNSASVEYSSSICSDIKNIYQGQKNTLYVSEQSLLKACYNPTYYNAQDFAEASNTVNQGTMLVFDNSQTSNVVGANPYYGNIEFRDRDTLQTLTTFTGIDSPKKILWSEYHGFYIVSGANVLWKIDNSVVSSIYAIGEWKILDFDCSERGNVIIVLNNGSNYIVRILDKNLYTILYEKRISSGNMSFCKYCNNNLFYFVEIDTDLNINNYLYDISSGELQVISQSSAIATTTTTTTFPIPTNKIQINSPVSGDSFQKGETYTIKWSSSASINDSVKIELFNGLKLIDTIDSSAKNIGTYEWTVPQYDSSSNYKIKITWLAAGNDSNYDTSGVFSIADEVAATTTTTTTPLAFYIIGVEFNSYEKNIVLVTNNGLIGIFDVETYDFYGLFDTGVLNVVSTAKGSKNINKFTGTTKVRVFVGSEVYLSDMWDSGVVETSLTSMYYGGGNNLIPGSTYYVNIQIYSEKYGWSDLQTQQFTMPL